MMKMNKPLFEKGDQLCWYAERNRIPGTIGIVIHVYRPHGHREFVYTIAFGSNHLQLLGSQLKDYFPSA